MKSISALCASAGVLAMATPVLAQQVSMGSNSGAAADEEVALQEVIIVTGSRVVQDGRDAPTPVTLTPISELQTTTPSNIPDALNKLPQLAGSTKDTGSGNGSAAGRSNVFTGNFLNLRSVGAIRTLILQDNRRVPPTAINGQVDTNTLPQMLVERVEVVTGGASAVYGSDAVTGVVNFVLDKEFTGLKAMMQSGIPERAGSASTRVGVAGGMDVFERGHFVASFEHFKDPGIESHADRDYLRNVPVYTGAGTDANPYRITLNGRMSTVADGGLITSGPLSLVGQHFVDSGTLAPFNRGTPTGTGSVSIGGDGSYYEGLPATFPLETFQGFARFDYDLTDDLNAYVQISGAEGRADELHNVTTPPASYTIYSGNAFLPAAVQAQLGTTPSFTLGRLNNDLSADGSMEQKTRSFYATAGLTGRLFEDFTWDAYYTHGEARVSSVTHNNINYPRLYAALDAVRDSAGNIVCRVTLTHPDLYPGCAPINMFGEGNQSAAALDYIYGDTSWEAVNRVDDVALSIAGELFSTWAGPVATALNLEYRTQALRETTSASPLQVPSFTGIRTGSAPGRAPASTVWTYALESAREGDNSVWEAGGEALVPLLAESVVGSLDFNGAVRYTEYSSSGPVTTWKAGLVYQPVPDLRVRAVRSRDIRAPTLADLYSGQSITFGTLNDLHTGVTGTVNVLSGGNPDLKPEVATTTTMGFVYQPSWLPRFLVSFDYFDITIDDAIGGITGLAPETLLECEFSGGTSSVCGAIIRPLPFSDTSAANFPTLVLNQSLNVAETYTRGFDVEMSYNFDLAAIAASLPGTVNLRFLLTHQPTLISRDTPTSPALNEAGAVGLSKTRIAGLIGYRNGPFTLNAQVRYSSEQERAEDPKLVFADPPLPEKYFTDLYLGYTFEPAGHDLETFLSVNNVFDTDPRVSPSTQRVGSPGTGLPVANGDDVLGRAYTIGFRFNY
jgi:iron complex outermembrane recepter protein